MSLLRRKALVNYKVSYTTMFGISGFYECTKLMWCNMFGNVTENTLDTWIDILEDEDLEEIIEENLEEIEE